MGATNGLLTGAGISADPPASLPLGDELRDRLLECCFTAASHLAPGAVEPHGIERIRQSRRTVLGRLEACLDGGSAADLLSCFRVTVPNEAHLIAAAHAVRGTLHVTLNFDDGVEEAYALLAGTRELPPSVPPVYRDALRGWRDVVRPSAPLTVVADGLDLVDYEQRPLLVKLRASARHDAGGEPTRPVIAVIDAQRLTAGQLTALSAVVDTRHLFIAGVSGADADCRNSLLPLLKPGRFSWTAAELDADLVARLHDIDAGQPILRPALEGIRASLPDAAQLPWPQVPGAVPGFTPRFAAWRARLPLPAAAETYAWLLSDIGFHDEATPILRALLSRYGRAQTRRLLRRSGTSLGGGCIEPRRLE